VKKQQEPARDANFCRLVLVSAAIPPVYSGAGHLFYTYAQRLEERGQLAFLLCLAFEEQSYQCFRPELKEHRIVRLPPEGTANDRADSFRKFAVKLWRLWFLFVSVGWVLLRRRSQYDIVHVVSESWVCAFAIFWARILGRRTVYETSLVEQDDLLTIRQTSGRAKYWMVSHARAFVAISPQLYKLCITAGIKDNEIHLIGNAVDTNTFHPVDGASKAMLRRKLHLPENDPIILFVGEICHRKGADLLPAIFRGVLAAFPRASLVLVGPKGRPGAVNQVAACIVRELEDYIAAGQVILIGTVSNVPEYMQASDIFLFPSRREGFGTVLVEAMACGLPSIVRNIEGISSFILQDGVEGVIVHDENPFAYASSIIRLLSDVAEYRAVSEKARRRVLSAFAAEVVDSQYRLMYDKLLCRGGSMSS